MKSMAEQSVIVEKVDDVDKEKKKKRRSNRRSKQNTPSTSACSSVNEKGAGVSQLGTGFKTKILTSSMGHSSSRKQELDMHPSNEEGPARASNEEGPARASNEEGPARASNVEFNSLPTMHINEKTESGGEARNLQGDDFYPSDGSGRIFSMSCPEPIPSGGPLGVVTDHGLPSFNQSGVHAQCKIFASHWSIAAVNEALEKGDAFKALFRVNAHNRLEAYCKIDGVSVDVLINGNAAQNRAVEGDIVVIKVDPLSLWTKMKGSTGPSNNLVPAEDVNVPPEVGEMVADGKGKSKLDVKYEIAQRECSLSPENGFHEEDYSITGNAVHQELIDHMGGGYINEHNPSASDFSCVGSSREQNEAIGALGRLCAMISSFPSKRPTGRVVGIVERSLRRDAIVGFLNVKQLVYYREGFKKEAKKNKGLLSISDHDYIQLTPTDPKFPKMMVLVRSLPDLINKRLHDGDLTVEMELVAARIDSWSEESPFPQAHVSHIFGRGGEVEPRLNAILFENAICCSEFSPETLSCLPHIPWEVPLEEYKNRIDLRDFCIFTIDPPTATDLDDALSVEKLSNGIIRVGVHIADASYFVLPDAALDIEAQIRSTSVYMLQRKLPMLPSLLSGNLGSLNPGVDRLAFSIFWDLNGAGDVIDRWIGRTVIRSCCKLSYENVQDIIDEENGTFFGNGCPQLYNDFEWSYVIETVKNLHKVSKTLQTKRLNDGALRLDNSKVAFLFDVNGIPYDSVLSEQKDSQCLVEEFMLLANTTAAEIISRAFPHSALLRRHPEPNMRKLKEFEAFCFKHGLELDTSSSGRFHWSLQRIREKLKDDSVLFDIFISYATKPMQLASYFCSGDLKDNVNDWGHYALAVPFYTHFTSPLRRYPDIVVHRTLAAVIEAEKLCQKHKILHKSQHGEEATVRCFTGIHFDKNTAESLEGREALSAAALKHGVPCAELLAEVAAHCNERKLASRHVKDACDKLYMWVLLKKKEILLSDARVLGLGPRFMSIYINKLAVERRIYYDEIEGLTAEWLEVTSTLVLSFCAYKQSHRRSGFGYNRKLDDAAWLVSPTNPGVELCLSGDGSSECASGLSAHDLDPGLKSGIEPAVFPLTVRLLATIPVALHAVGGDDGPLDIGVRLYMSSYFR
ncbi:DIS3-like exonuclease 2 [Tripterygium wilfordii]|uniref:DIS3-like exonuclease 2 n=1 Tax=Tripterygium wilfordii TaxID=458696 RepID=A0A7J7D1U6_TRIWF|nr:DIS3-like exonuclease 2 [Tripterygium wilfordii]KAF5740300.1 DIS3-like exonuclease 2 [Tripterygium wilfordii]